MTLSGTFTVIADESILNFRWLDGPAKQKSSWSAGDDDDFGPVVGRGGGAHDGQPQSVTATLTDNGQMVSLMQSHVRRKVKERDRGEVPTCQLVAMFRSHPHPLPGRANTPHGSLCTAAGTDVTHDAIFLPAG